MKLLRPPFLAKILANDPAKPRLTSLTSVPFLNREAVCEPVVEPVKAAVIIGTSTCPVRPVFAYEGDALHVASAWQMAKFDCAFLNSVKKPFSKILVSFRSTCCQRPTP